MGGVTYWLEDQTLNERTTLVVVGAVTYWFEDQTLGREDYTNCSGRGDVLVRKSDSRSRGLH